MALEFIISIEIGKGKIDIPGGANCYRNMSKTRGHNNPSIPRVNFYYANPTIPKDFLPIPNNASKMEKIDFLQKTNYIVWGKDIFYDKKGNVLKQGRDY
jgi:hypothetical protein